MPISRNSVFLITTCLLLAGCGSFSSNPAAKPVPCAQPVMVNRSVNPGGFIPAELEREIRNDGPTGTVHIEVETTQNLGGYDTHRESGAEKILRETFTRSLEPELVSHPNIVRTNRSLENALFQASETRPLANPIPQYRPSLFSNQHLKSEATGISVISPPL